MTRPSTRASATVDINFIPQDDLERRGQIFEPDDRERFAFLLRELLVHLHDRAADPERRAVRQFVQRGDRLIFPVGEKRGIGIERMAGDIKAEQLFFVRHLLVLGPGNDSMRRRLRRRRRHVVEERDLAAGPVPVRRRRGRQRFIDAGEQFRAFAPEEIERAALHQAFQDLAIGDARIEPPAEILQRSEFPPRLPLPDRRSIAPCPTFLIAARP